MVKRMMSMNRHDGGMHACTPHACEREADVTISSSSSRLRSLLQLTKTKLGGVEYCVDLVLGKDGVGGQAQLEEAMPWRSREQAAATRSFASAPPIILGTYHNPHYYDNVSSSCCCRSSMIVASYFYDDVDGDGMEQQEEEWYGGCGVPELVARVEELRAELEFERRMRQKVEALNEALAAELAEERRRGEAAEAERARAREEVEEERRMLRVAELWREERVRMKLADARAAVEEKLREIAADADDAGHRAAADATACGCSCSCKSSGGGGGSPVLKSSAASQQGQKSPVSGQLHRREAATSGVGGGSENPHIRRGIKGFVEFPRAVRVRPRGEEQAADLVSNLECQRAQLRVLMRHRSPAALADAPENLVV